MNISMDEIKQILEPREKITYNGKPEYAPYITGVVLAAILASGVIGIFAGVFLKSILFAGIIGIIVFVLGMILGNMAFNRIHYALTNKRIIIQSGIIGRDFKSIDYDRMQNVSVDVGILGVIFKVGSIKIFTGEMEAAGGRKLGMQARYDHFNYVASPYEVLKKLQTHLSARKEKYFR